MANNMVRRLSLWGSWRGICSSLVTVTLLAGTATISKAQQQPALAYQSAVAGEYGDYLLGPGDQVKISVLGYPEFEGTYAIAPDGMVNIPLLGAVSISGKTLNQVDQAMTYHLQYYLVEPEVSVGLAVLRPVIVTISGEVYRPGPVQLTALTSNNATQDRDLSQTFIDGLPTLSSAILAAGGVRRDADIRSVTVRRLLPGGNYESITVDLWEAIQAQGTGASLGLRDGDLIHIPHLAGDELDRRLIATSSLAPAHVRVRVVGEVVTPGEVLVSPDSSVSGAVAAAGGPTSDAQLARVALVRMNADGEIIQQPMDLSQLIDNQQVQDGDVVIVAKKGNLTFFDTLGRILNPLNLLSIFGL